jgi:hypothetical protein
VKNLDRRLRYADHLDEERARSRSYYIAHRDEIRAGKALRYARTRDALPPKACVACGTDLIGCHRARIRCASCPPGSLSAK